MAYPGLRKEESRRKEENEGKRIMGKGNER